MKSKTVYVCSQCGAENNKWSGKCPNCDSWNSMSESLVKFEISKKTKIRSSDNNNAPVLLNSIELEVENRTFTGIDEFDRVLGGGIVNSSVILIGGDPGIGKSTLLLQMCSTVDENKKILYVSGEESIGQLKLRAKRLKTNTDNIYVISKTNMEDILNSIDTINPDIVIIDSIQTMYRSDLSSAPGNVAQVRECAMLLISKAKNNNMTIFLVGHVTKEGMLAGPRVLEHMVDCVLYFEGERHLNYRILRAVKNRFGATNEIGVFEMTNDGLAEVKNPSMMLLSGRPQNASGAVVACVMEGSRPVLAEVQALATSTSFGSPRRMCTGYDYNRAALLIAVLEKHARIFLSNKDVYINVIGGLKIVEPAADLPVILSIASSFKDAALGDDLIAMGEVGLAGEIRAVSSIELRIAEGKKLGFKRFLIPYQNKFIKSDKFDGLEIYRAKNISEALKLLI